ncbi:MAG: hypothetical protein ACJ75H_16635 [Thermoanaerobaculia bacterium]
MKRRPSVRLKLHRETLRALTPPELSNAAGAWTTDCFQTVTCVSACNFTCENTCPFSCPAACH